MAQSNLGFSKDPGFLFFVKDGLNGLTCSTEEQSLGKCPSGCDGRGLARFWALSSCLTFDASTGRKMDNEILNFLV